MAKKKQAPFDGFSPKVREFFAELAENNNKEWFDEHRAFYTKNIREVCKSLVADMGEAFAENGLNFTADPKKSIFRINRDIRFSPNKDPYKTNLGVYFKYSAGGVSDRKPIEAPVLYFHLDAESSFVAGGVHGPDSASLKAIRQKISDEYEEFLSIIENDTFINEFPKTLQGESLKNPPKGFDKEDPTIDVLKLKQFDAWSDVDFKDTESAGLKDLLIRKALIITPFLDFLGGALEKEDKK